VSGPDFLAAIDAAENGEQQPQPTFEERVAERTSAAIAQEPILNEKPGPEILRTAPWRRSPAGRAYLKHGGGIAP